MRRSLTGLTGLLTDLLTSLLTGLLTGMLTGLNKQVIKALLALVIHAPYNRLRRGLLAEAVEPPSWGRIFILGAITQ